MKTTLFLSPARGLAVIFLGTLVVPLDTAVNVAFPAIVHSFDLPIPAIRWVVISYTLTYAALILLFGRMGDMFGHRIVFLLGSGCSAVAFLGCAVAPSWPLLLAGRVAQGIGAALVLSCGPALATGLYPETQRSRILGLYAMVFGIGAAFGSLAAGALVGRFGWAAVFWFRAPLGLGAFLLARGLPVLESGEQSERFDTAGAFLLVLATAALLLGLNRMPSSGAVVFLALSAVAALGFVLREQHAEYPIVDLHCFRRGDFAVVTIGNIAVSLTGFTVPLLVPFFLDRIAHLGALPLGVLLAVSSLGSGLAAPLAGRLVGYVEPARLAFAAAMVTVLGQFLLSTGGTSPSLPLFAIWLFVQGVGIGLFQVAYFDIAATTLPRAHRGVAGSMVLMTRTLGIVIGATALMLAFRALRADTMVGGGDAAVFVAGFRGVFRLTALLPLGVAVALLFGWWRVPWRRVPPGHGV